MLGFTPVSAVRSFSYVTAAIAGATSLTFAATATVGLYAQMAGATSITFAPASVMSTIQGLTGDTSLTFDVSGNVTVAGKPIVVSAIPDSFTIRASMDDYSTKAMPDSYITRGWE